MRQKNDSYPTPIDDARRIIRHLNERGFLVKSWRVMDPACGEGNLLHALCREDFKVKNLLGIEIDPHLAKENTIVNPFVEDALKIEWPECDMVFMNPPYSHALEFVEKAVKHCKFVVALLRLSFMGSQKRAAFHAKHTSDIYVIPKRIKFFGNGNDTTDSAWFVFRGHPVSTWQVLP